MPFKIEKLQQRMCIGQFGSFFNGDRLFLPSMNTKTGTLGSDFSQKTALVVPNLISCSTFPFNQDQTYFWYVLCTINLRC